MHLLQEFLAVLYTVSRVGDREWVADCPLHRSCNRKLHIVRTKKYVYVECEDGCLRSDVLAALTIAADDALSLVCWGKPGHAPLPRRASFWAKTPEMLPLPSGNIYDMWPHTAFVDDVMRSVHDIPSLIEACEVFPNRESYSVEAIIHHAFDLLGVTDAEKANVRGRKLGIHQEHPIRKARDIYANFAANEGAAHAAAVPLFWGSPTRSGPSVYQAANKMLRLSGLDLALKPDHTGTRGITMTALIVAWADASNVSHHFSRRALAALTTQIVLTMDRPIKDSTLDSTMLGLATTLGGGNPRKALVLFRCFQRIAAYESDGLVQWHSTWLRGSATHADAIPGASSFPDVPAILHEHVLRRVRGHQAGKAAARYEVLIPMKPGHYDAKRAATFLSLTLGPDGSPVRPARGRV